MRRVDWPRGVWVLVQANVRLMIDAEHSYFQPAIDHAVLELQRVFNAHRPTVFNTIQCYTKACCRSHAALASSSCIIPSFLAAFRQQASYPWWPWHVAGDDCHWHCCSVQIVGSCLGEQEHC